MALKLSVEIPVYFVRLVLFLTRNLLNSLAQMNYAKEIVARKHVHIDWVEGCIKMNEYIHIPAC